ncbi:MAG: hypothetical protein KF774_11800 [Planctomyces sp.]|nr:hypothetical protein [Planctomyces sp.]
MRWICISLAWIAAAAWVSHDLVGIVPSHIVRFDSSRELLGVVDDGIWVGRRTTPAAWERFPTLRGPLERYEFPSGRCTQLAFDGNDAVEFPQLTRDGLGLLRRDGALHVVDVRTGERLDTLPPVDRILAILSVPGRRQLLYNDDAILRLRDLAERREVWSANGYRYPKTISGNVISCRTATNGPEYATDGCALLDLDSGRPMDLLNVLGEPPLDIVLAEDCPYAVVTTWKETCVCSVETGAVLWDVPVTRQPFRIGADGDELHLDQLDASGSVQTVRWRLADGRALTDMPPQAPGHAFRRTSGHEDYIVEHVYRPRPRMPGWIERVAPPLLASMVEVWMPSQRTVQQIVDVRSNRVLGQIDPDVAPVHVSSGMVLAYSDRMEFYSLPPRRDWRTIAAWSCLPPLGACVLGIGWRLVRPRWALARGRQRAPAAADLAGSPAALPG